MAGLGSESFVRAKVEATWGTKETTGFWTIPFIAEDIDIAFEDDTNESIAAGLFPPAPVKGRYAVKGTLTCQLSFDLIQQFLYSCAGYAGETSPSANSKQEIYNWVSAYKGLTLNIGRGDIGTGKCWVYTGMTVVSVEFQFPENGKPRVVFEFIGKDEVSAAGGDTPGTVASPDPGLTPHWAASYGPAVAGWVLKPSIAGVCIKSARFKVDRKAEMKYCLGSQTPVGISSTDFFSLTGEYELEFNSRAIYDDFKAFVVEDTSAQNQITLRGDVIESAVAYKFDVIFNSMIWRSGTPKVDQRGQLRVNCAFQGCDNGGSQGATMEPIAITTIATKAQASW